jgi:hypothetical protein
MRPNSEADKNVSNHGHPARGSFPHVEVVVPFCTHRGDAF